jgi:chromate transporter
MSEQEASVNEQEPGTASQAQLVPLSHIARTFLGIGLASFSLAALGEAKEWMTGKRKWFSDEEYMQGLGLAQLMPGAPTVNLSAYLGFRLRGLAGAATATICFLIPCFLLMLALTHLYLKYGEMSVVSGLFRGLGALVVGLVLNTIINLWRSGVKTIFNWLMAIVGFVMVFWFHMGVMRILLIAGGASVMVVLLSHRFHGLSGWTGPWSGLWMRGMRVANLRTEPSHQGQAECGSACNPRLRHDLSMKVGRWWRTGSKDVVAIQGPEYVSACSRVSLPPNRSQIARLIFWLLLFLVLDLSLIRLKPELMQMARSFLGIGALVFGSGYSMLPFIQHTVVNQFNWLTNEQFAVALALSLITPGPVTIIGAFIGYKVAGVTGALVGLVNMYFPAWAMTTVVTGPYAEVGQVGYVKQVIGGVVATFIGTLFVVLIRLASSALADIPSIFMASAAFLVQRFVKIDTVWIVIGGALVSLVIFR